MTQRTYWHLSELGKRPTDYDITSTKLLYYVERGLEIDAPIGAWYRTHQAGSELACHDWERFRDPRETTYSKYVDLQRTKEAFVDGVLAAAEDREHVPRLAPAWRTALASLISPLRYPVHGLQMIAAYVGHMAPSGRVVIAAMLQAADEARRIERLAYRLRELQLADPDVLESGTVPPSWGAAGRARWERDPMWQPLRELIERLLVTYDWGEALVALTCVVKPRFDALFTTELAELSRGAGDDVFANVLFSLGEDARWHRIWSAALIEVALADRPANRAVIAAWIARWTPLAVRAIASFAPVFGAEMPVAVEAAAEAWLVAAGLADPERGGGTAR